MAARTITLVMLCMLLAACGPEPTPVVITPIILETEGVATEEAVSAPTELPALRYGLLPNIQGYVSIDMLASDRVAVDFLTAETTPEQLNAYDVVVGYGLYEGWQVSPVESTVALIVNTDLPPFDEPDIAAIIHSAINPADSIVQIAIPGMTPLSTTATELRVIRETLANLGYPDGFTVYATIEAVPGNQFVIQALEAVHINIVSDVSSSIAPHLLLVMWQTDNDWQTWVDQFGEENVVSLYSIPISYRAAENLTIRFDDSGLPIVAP